MIIPTELPPEKDRLSHPSKGGASPPNPSVFGE